MLSFTQYPTFVVFLAVFLGAIVAMALMPVFIKFLRSHLIGQQVRADGPESHLVKQGTPTMGGIIMLIAATVVVAVLAEPVPETWLIMAAVLATGALGLFDDASKVAHERSLGLTPKAKLIGQFFQLAHFIKKLQGSIAVSLLFGVQNNITHMLLGKTKLYRTGPSVQCLNAAFCSF